LAGQYPAVDEHLTGRENLDMVSRLYHFDSGFAKKRSNELLERFDLTDAANRPVKTYSGGMRRRLDLAASIVAKPRVLFLDEPTTGLDPRTRIEMWEVIRELVRDGATLLLTTQYLEEADELANYIAVIDRGKLIAQGTSDELKALLGSDVLEVKVAHRNDLDKALELAKELSTESPQIYPEKGAFTVSVPNSTQSLIQAIRVLDTANIALDDINLRRPTLDDVFLSITGKTSTQEMAAVSAAN
jgi:ABC-2 type transport system ATP-binding protein